MKTEIRKHQSFKAISYVVNEHAEAFTDNADILPARDSFIANTSQIGEILSQLMRPVSTVRTPKMDSQDRLRKELSKMLGIGISIATTQDNQPLITVLKNYDIQWKRCSAYQLYENALHVYNELSALKAAGSVTTLTDERLAAFQTMVNNFGETLDMTDYRLTDRRRSRQDIKLLIKANNKILRMQLDTFMRHLEDDFPEFYSQYMFLRKRRYKRSRNGNGATELCEISGTVTDSVSGQPLANAVVNLLSPETIETTDEDGVYVIEELAAGDYTVSCHLDGYEVPAAITVTAVAGDSLVVDFALVPAQQQAAA